MIRIALALALIASPAAAQQVAWQQCADRQGMTRLLTRNDMTKIVQGVSVGGSLVEWWGDADGRWRIVVTDRRGTSCTNGIGLFFDVFLAPKGDPS